jgi:FSR family fosmidomycin resistance protein-like MFS transporter
MSAATDAPRSTLTLPLSQARRTLLGAGIAHALHDGYTDTIYVLLPIWQAEGR